MSDVSNLSIYYEALWVVALFAATATLREAVGELCVHSIAKSILNSTHVSGKTLDTLISCSNGGRSLGFGALWRMWNTNIPKYMIALPFLCWVVGFPFKLIAVQAVRGGNEFLGFYGTWILGISWIVFCIAFKLVAIVADYFHGWKDHNGKVLSFRRIFQARFCTLEGYGMMISPEEYEESHLRPKPRGLPLSVDVELLKDEDLKETLRISLVRKEEI
jgi:hypothetical protein